MVSKKNLVFKTKFYPEFRLNTYIVKDKLSPQNTDVFKLKSFKVNTQCIDKSLQLIDENLSDVDNIISDIEKLLFIRDTLLSNNIYQLSTMVGLEKYVGVTSTQLFTEYDENSFLSPIVREAVINLRKLFFDDSLLDFQQYRCIKISRSDLEHATITFTFSTKDLSKRFYLNIPDYLQSLAHSENCLNDGVSIGFWRTKYYYETFIKSFDLTLIKDALKEFVAFQNNNLGLFKLSDELLKKIKYQNNFHLKLHEVISAFKKGDHTQYNTSVD